MMDKIKQYKMKNFAASSCDYDLIYHLKLNGGEDYWNSNAERYTW